MSVSTLAISCLTSSSLPWFVNLTFRFPLHHFSLQCQTLLSPSDIATTEHYFHFGPAASFFSGTISNCSSLLPSSMLNTFRSEGLIFWCHIFLPFHTIHGVLGASLVAQKLKPLPPMRETWVRSLEKEMATHSSILAWRIPWTEEPGRLQSTGSQRVGHDWATSLSL